jgi:predicted nucleic acid-binding Zn ribbon protein
MSVDSESSRRIKGFFRASTIRKMNNARKAKIQIKKLGDPTIDEMRECIKDGYCWWCDTGGYKVLAGHTSKAHGITAAEIRELAHFKKKATICLPEVSAFRKKVFEDLIRRGIIKRNSGGSKGVKKQFSTAGLEIQKNKKLSDNLKKKSAEYHEKAKKPHRCPICNSIIPKSKPKYCSDKCRKIAITKKRGSNIKLSETRKRMFASGKLKPSIQNSKSHDCPICGKFIKKSHPLTCSKECHTELLRRLFAKPHKCPVCGKSMPKATPITCSPECRRIIRIETGKRVLKIKHPFLT